MADETWYTRVNDDGSDIELTLRDGKGRLVDLTGATATFVVLDGTNSGAGNSTVGVLADAANGVVIFTPELTIAGTFSAYVLVVFADTSERTFPTAKDLKVVVRSRT